MLTEYIESSDDKIRAKNDKKQFTLLLTRGFVKAIHEECRESAAKLDRK
jgi:hypothetical protein